MDEQPFPLPRATRETEILAGDGGATYGPFGFKVFDTADLRAYVSHEGEAGFDAVAFTAQKVAGLEFDDFTVTFAQPLPATSRYTVEASRLHERQVAATRGGAISGVALEKELSKQGSVIEELRRDVDRGGSIVPVAPGRVLVAGEDGRMRPGPDVAGIIAASEVAGDAAAAAQASASMAATSEANADADALATAADRVQTGLDATATAADRVQTGLDATATAADRVQTGLDATATAADRVQTGLDAAATAADRVQTGLDAAATAADRVQTGLDATAAAASRAKAEDWATKAEDVPVESGPDRYSAFHWAQKAASLVLDSLAGLINGAAAKATPADNDRFPLTDSAAGYAVKRTTWANIKTALASTFLEKTGGVVRGILDVVGEGAQYITVRIYSNAASPLIYMFKSRGTEAAKTSVQAGDVLGEIIWVGFDGTANQTGIRLTAKAAATFSAELSTSISLNLKNNGTQFTAQEWFADGRSKLTGPLELPGAPTDALHAATKGYVDAGLAAKIGFYAGSTRDETDFPIGHSVLMHSTVTIDRSAVVQPGVHGTNTREYLQSSTPLLSGVWRSRGMTGASGSGSILAQRVS